MPACAVPFRARGRCSERGTPHRGGKRCLRQGESLFGLLSRCLHEETHRDSRMMSTFPLIARSDEIRAGIITPTDMALDAEMWRWAPDGVSLLFTRARHVGDEDTVAACVRDLSDAAPAAFAHS